MESVASFGACDDLQGRGSPARRFREEIAPETGGWSNLL